MDTVKRMVDSFGELMPYEASNEWNLPPVVAAILFVLPLAGALIVALTAFERPLYHFLTDEDSLLEWMQFAGYVAASLLGLLIAARLWQAGQRLPALCYLGFSLGTFFIAGEEIAWGQRILGLHTPWRLERINHQHEITVHNITKIQVAFNVVMMLIGLYGSIAAGLVRFQNRGQANRLASLFVPPLFLTSSFLILFGYKFMRFVFFPDPRFMVVRYGELAELCLAFGLAAFTFLNWRRLRSQPEAARMTAAPMTQAQPWSGSR